MLAAPCLNKAAAQSNHEYEEVSVNLNVQRIGEIEIAALIRDETAYLPVGDVFDFLHIKNVVSVKMDTVSGSFMNPQAKFIIDKTHNRILYADKTYDLKPGDLISSPTNLYLRSDYFGPVFGLTCTFSFRNLSITLSTELELPVIREMRQSQMRANVNKLKGNVLADTTIGRSYPLFHFGTADYSIINSTYDQSAQQTTRIGLGLGGIIAGGETNMVFNYQNNAPFSESQQYYLWRLVDNENPLVKQLSAGKIYGQSIASIYAPIVGVQVTNTPTTYRRSFGTYTISNYTEPNWVVELYVNGVLITYVKADASGFYTFNAPLVYGNSMIKLRFYGPYGEERSVIQNISVPFNFLPRHDFEYTASTGVVEDGRQSRFFRLSNHYGLSTNVTIGFGTEYLSTIASGTTIPFFNASVRLLSNLFFSGEYDYNVQTKALLNYQLSSATQLELSDTWYKKGQTAISNTYLEDRKAILSFPVRTAGFSAYSRITLEQIMLQNTTYTTAQWLLSGAFGTYSAGVNTYGSFIADGNPYIYSDFSISTRTLKNILITQHAQYEFVGKKLVGIKTELEKRIFKNGYLNASFDRNFNSKISNAELGFRYDFSYAQAGASIRKSGNLVNYLQSVRGSLIYDSHTDYFDANIRTSVGKGMVLVVPFLDLNGNGRRDPNEPKVPGLKVRVNGGRVQENVKDTTIRITDLEAFANYILELDPTAFDRIAWQLKKKVYSVAADPNFLKIVEVPVMVSGEVSGRVTLRNGADEKGMGRMLVSIFNAHVMVARTVTEADGYFTYLGLPPGAYSAQIDAAQLEKLHLTSLPAEVPFTIARNIDGSVVDNLYFVVRSKEE